MCTCLRIAVEAFHDGFEQATEAFKRNQRGVAELAEARRELVATSEALSKAEQENKGLKVRQVHQQTQPDSVKHKAIGHAAKIWRACKLPPAHDMGIVLTQPASFISSNDVKGVYLDF